MDLSKYAKPLDILYNDLMTAYRGAPVKDADGTTNYTRAYEPFITDEPCRIVFKREDLPNEARDTGEPANISQSIICAPETDIRAGDWIELVRANTATYEGYAGKPFRRETHIQFALEDEDRA